MKHYYFNPEINLYGFYAVSIISLIWILISVAYIAFDQFTSIAVAMLLTPTYDISISLIGYILYIAAMLSSNSENNSGDCLAQIYNI